LKAVTHPERKIILAPLAPVDRIVFCIIIADINSQKTPQNNALNKEFYRMKTKNICMKKYIVGGQKSHPYTSHANPQVGR